MIKRLICLIIGHRHNCDYTKIGEGIAPPLIEGMPSIPYETIQVGKIYCGRCGKTNIKSPKVGF